jgi:predicted secreted protein
MLCAGGCSGSGGGAGGPSTGGGIDAVSASSFTQLNPASAMQTLTAGAGRADRGSVGMRSGQTLHLRLVSGAGGNYVWRALPLESVSERNTVRVGTRKIEQATAEPGSAVGSAVYDTFAVRGVRPGVARVQFVYALPTAPDLPPAKTFTLDVNITP